MLPIRRILFPTDFSEAAHQAFRVAASLARDYGATLTVLHVAVPPQTISGEMVLDLTPPVTPEELRAWYDPATTAGLRIHTEYLVTDGDPAKAILDAAQDHLTDMIVMASHGRTGLARVLMGSVAETVLRRAPCPVLIVKTLADALRADKPSHEATDSLLLI